MSLAQYLALGRSIKNVSGPGRYKVASGPVAPRFDVARRTTETTRRGGGVAVETIFDQSQPPVVGIEERLPEPAGETTAAAAPMTTSSVEKPDAPVTPVSSRGRWFIQATDRWTGRRDEQEGPRQGELALGLVQPVRNDLRDSDLEVVPVSNPATKVERAGWWSRLRQWLIWPWSRRMNRRSR